MTGERPDWEMWGPAHDAALGYEELASFVVDSVNVGHKFNVNVHHDDSPVGLAAAAKQVYVAFAAANLPSRWQAWSAGRGQWIKDPVWFAEQSGTCLDFAVTYAAVLLAHHVAPVLAVTRTHAYVCVDLTRSPRRGGAERTRPMFGGMLGLDRVVRVSEDMDAADGLLILANDECLPVDITQAASTAQADGERSQRPSFDVAVRSARRIPSAEPVWLVDVLGLQAEGPQIVRVPFGAQQRPRPAIATLVPDVDTADYRPQPDIETAMADPTTVGLILHGPQGIGKSMAALVGLKAQQSLAGWFLNATDRESLVTSLAFAELAETQVPDSMIATGEEARWFAGQAMARLGGDQPWMVVHDNAEAGPAAIADLLPVPRADRGQRLIVTTTNPAWLRWVANQPGWKAVEVTTFDDAALDDFGVPSDPALRELVAGRGLFAAAFGRAARAGLAFPLVLAETGELDPGAVLLWTAVEARLSAADDGIARAALHCARAAAWMQPDRITEAVLGRIALDVDGAHLASDAIDQLVGLGILSRYETGTVRIHRLIAAAVRATIPTVAALRVVGTESYAEDAKHRADSATQRLHEELLGRTCDEDGPWVAAAHSIVVLLEHRGKAAAAAEPSRRIIGLLADRDEDSLDRSTALRLADALHARARAVNQDAKTGHDEALAAIDDWVERSDRLRRRHGDALGVSKSTTMRGLLLNKAAETVDDLTHARDILRAARDERLELWGSVHEDTARAVFNLGAPNIRLAQRDPANAAAYLDEARLAYRTAWEIRQALFPTAGHPFRAASDNGLALADYYDALIVQTDPVVRQNLLRKAARKAHDAACIRETFDQLDDNDTVKSIRLASKIADARAAFAEHTASNLRADRAAERTPAEGESAVCRSGSWPCGWPDAAALEGKANAAREVVKKHRETLSELGRWQVAAAIGTSLQLPNGVNCMVTTRHGGFGRQGNDADGRLLDFGTMNLGDHVGDSSHVVWMNRQLVCEALGLHGLTVADQQHGSNVALIDEHLRFAGHVSHTEAQRLLPATDGMVTDQRATPLTILVADCVPVALYDPVRRVIGVAHAGRNGTVTGIVPNVIETMRTNFGTDPVDLHIAFGPHIGSGDYEVGAEEVSQFLSAFDGDSSLVTLTQEGTDKASLDLEGALRRQLTTAGVPEHQVTSTGVNTRRATQTYFSDRHTRFDLGGSQSGRFALICWLP